MIEIRIKKKMYFKDFIYFEYKEVWYANLRKKNSFIKRPFFKELCR